MKLELNLVESPVMGSSTVNLLERNTVLLETEDAAGVLDQVFTFLTENLPTISSIVTNAEAINFLRSATSLTLPEFLSLRWVFGQSGLDVQVYALNESETANRIGIDMDSYEYNIVNHNFTVANFVPSVSKITLGVDSNRISDVYQKAYDEGGFMPAEVVGINNGLQANIKQLMDTEKLTGKIISGLSTYISNTLDFFGVDIVIILPAKDGV